MVSCTHAGCEARLPSPRPLPLRGGRALRRVASPALHAKTANAFVEAYRYPSGTRRVNVFDSHTGHCRRAAAGHRLRALVSLQLKQMQKDSRARDELAGGRKWRRFISLKSIAHSCCESVLILKLWRHILWIGHNVSVCFSTIMLSNIIVWQIFPDLPVEAS
jgi:hypothetical protein